MKPTSTTTAAADLKDAIENAAEGYYCEDCKIFIFKGDYWEHNEHHPVLKQTMIEGWVAKSMAKLEAQQTDDTLSGLRTPSFDEWLKRLRACTTAFQHRSGAWTIFDQICHASSEVSEVYQAIRHDEGRPKMLEEICDSVLASITMAHVAGFTDAELGFAMETTLQKVERRAGIDSAKAEGKE